MYTLLLAGTFIVLRGDTRPGTQTLWGFGYGHVHSGFSNYVCCRFFCNSRDGSSQFGTFVVRFYQVWDFFIKAFDAFIDVIDMFSADLHFNRLAAVQFITDNGFGHIIRFIFCFFLEQGIAVSGVKGFAGEGIINYGGCWFPKCIRQDRRNGNIGDSEGVLETVFFTRTVAGQFLALPEQFP